MQINEVDLKSYISHLNSALSYIDNGNTLEAKEIIDNVISYLEYDIKNGVI